VTTLRVLIVDDEPVARDRVKMFLANDPEIEILGEYGNGTEARDAIIELRPDLVFLDIEMPELSGMEVARSLPPGHVPVILFLTAHDHYAVEAFEASAADYLLKPFNQERFDRALARARKMIETSGRKRGAERIAVKKSRGRVVFVKTASIRWVGAEGNYVRLYTPETSFLVRDSIQSLEQSLDPLRFVRIHRSTIINIDCLVELQSDEEGSQTVLLDKEEALSVGPKYRERLERVLGVV
jgi:two-component system LytT family response regulator